jgi:acetyltransferase-like isoleucine patch superfamily enzyme
MIIELWKHRDRPAPFSTPWLKAWAKRLLQGPMLVKQAFYHLRLRMAGAQVAGKTFFSEPSRISGDLTRLSVGEGSFIGRAELAVHDQMSIGRNVCINDGARLLTASHDVSDPHWGRVTRPVVVHDHVWIAVDAIILPGVTLGRGAVVGAGAVVTRDVPECGIVVGNPARLLDKKRVSSLEYSPVSHLALFTAWNRLAEPLSAPEVQS